MSNPKCKGCKYEHKGWTPSCSKCLDAESDDYIGYESRVGSKTPQTNADRIRAMSDEELADVLHVESCTGKETMWREEFLEWLKQEVE